VPLWLLLEFTVLFVVLPAAFRLGTHRLPAIPTLWVVTIYCLIMLLRDPEFPRESLWNPGPFASSAPLILGLWIPAVALIGAVVFKVAPHLFLNFPRTYPGLWALIMVLYPVASVYPQGIIYRSFLFHRYRDLFGEGVITVLVSALAFSYLHIIFRNWVAVGMTFLGGVIFAYRHWQTGSLLVSSVEHALYGCLMFTIGLGEFFYHTGRRAQPQV
jgi:membrane protease YdiL (CAAX protease family)